MESTENNTQDIQTIAQRSVKRKQKERKLRKQRKKAKRLKGFLRFFVLIMLLFGMYEFIRLPQWYLPQDAFLNPNSQRVEILNNNIASDKLLQEALKDVKVEKKPIFLISVKPIKRELFKIPIIKKIYVRRYGFPARVQIIVRERIPSVALKTDLKSLPVAFMTSDGVLITKKEFMPQVESYSPLQILIASNTNIIKDWDEKRVEQIKKIVKSVEAYSSEDVEYVDLRNPNDVYVKIASTNIRLGVLDSTVFDRIKRIYTILPQIDDMDGQIKYVDLSWDKVNYLKLKDDKQQAVEEENDVQE